MANFVNIVQSAITLDPESYKMSKIINTDDLRISPQEWKESKQVDEFVAEEAELEDNINYQKYVKTIKSRLRVLRTKKAAMLKARLEAEANTG